MSTHDAMREQIARVVAAVDFADRWDGMGDLAKRRRLEGADAVLAVIAPALEAAKAEGAREALGGLAARLREPGIAGQVVIEPPSIDQRGVIEYARKHYPKETDR